MGCLPTYLFPDILLEFGFELILWTSTQLVEVAVCTRKITGHYLVSNHTHEPQGRLFPRNKVTNELERLRWVVYFAE